MADRAAPPIPATCTARPTTLDGLVIPFGNARLADGGCDFRVHHNTAWTRCWTDNLCQVCGTRLKHPIVLLCGPRQLSQLLFDEPGLHPECARYVGLACPMVAGRRERYRTGEPVSARARGGRCFEPGCDCGGWVPTPGVRQPDMGGDPAHAWFAVYATGYHPAATPDGVLTGGACFPADVLRVRQVSEPGRLFERWRPVPDWLDGYQPLDIVGGR